MPTDKRTTPSETPGLLLMLDGNPTLQKLVATWRNAHLAGVKKEVQIARWALITGLRPMEVDACWDSLFDNGFVTRAGEVDDMALKYLANLAMGRLPAAARPKPKKDGGVS